MRNVSVLIDGVELMHDKAFKVCFVSPLYAPQRASPPCFSVRSEHGSTENKVKVVTLWCWLRDRSPSSLIAMTTFPPPE